MPDGALGPATYTGGLALTSTGTVYGWGLNDAGDAGTGTGSPIYIRTPQLVVDSAGAPITGITQVRGRYKGGQALTSDGRIYTWGTNAGGQLADGGVTSRKYADLVLTAPGTPLAGPTPPRSPPT